MAPCDTVSTWPAPDHGLEADAEAPGRELSPALGKKF